MILKIEALSVALEGRQVLFDIDVVLVAGTFVGLVGPNGSGKSTLLRCIAGVQRPSSGRLAFGAQGPAGGPPSIGVAVDPAQLPTELTGRQCLELMAHARGTRALPEALIGTLQFAPWLGRYVGEYSHGTRQKLSLLLALVGEPTLVLLDESLNGLDLSSSIIVKDHLLMLVHERQCTVMLATHGIDSAADLFDELVLLDQGRVAARWDRAGLARLKAGGSLERAMAGELVSACLGQSRSHKA